MCKRANVFETAGPSPNHIESQLIAPQNFQLPKIQSSKCFEPPAPGKHALHSRQSNATQIVSSRKNFQFGISESEQSAHASIYTALDDPIRPVVCGRLIFVEPDADGFVVETQETFEDLDRHDSLTVAMLRLPAHTIASYCGVSLVVAIASDEANQLTLLARWLESKDGHPSRSWTLFARGIDAAEWIAAEIDRHWQRHASEARNKAAST